MCGISLMGIRHIEAGRLKPSRRMIAHFVSVFGAFVEGLEFTGKDFKGDQYSAESYRLWREMRFSPEVQDAIIKYAQQHLELILRAAFKSGNGFGAYCLHVHDITQFYFSIGSPEIEQMFNWIRHTPSPTRNVKNPDIGTMLDCMSKILDDGKSIETTIGVKSDK